MRRRWGVLNLAQGGVYVAFALFRMAAIVQGGVDKGYRR